MNREEQIQLASPYGNSYQDSAFINGAKWADSHPKDDGVEMWVARDLDKSPYGFPTRQEKY